MRVVLTGATGFVGAHLAEALQSDHDVTAIARRPPPQPSRGGAVKLRVIFRSRSQVESAFRQAFQ